jgi:pyroglutamyl-peptidase
MMWMETLLLTGFEPFQQFTANPSGEVASSLDQQQVGRYRVVGRVLPVSFKEAGSLLERWMEEVSPAALLSLGLAAGRCGITVERFAVNWREGPDSSGEGCPGERIEPEGDAAYFTTLPLQCIVDHISSHGLPASISNSAGVYVCNHIIYQTLHRLRQQGITLPAGFIHLPASHLLALEPAGALIPSWSSAELIRGVSLAVEAIGAVACNHR